MAQHKVKRPTYFVLGCSECGRLVVSRQAGRLRCKTFVLREGLPDCEGSLDDITSTAEGRRAIAQVPTG